MGIAVVIREEQNTIVVMISDLELKSAKLRTSHSARQRCMSMAKYLRTLVSERAGDAGNK